MIKYWDSCKTWLLVAFMIFSIGKKSKAQGNLDVLQDSLFYLGQKMFQHPEEPQRLDANFKFVRTLVTALKEPNSLDYPFDSLKMISILTSSDRKIRIFSWNIPLNDGSYLYYGSIQLASNDGHLKLIPLLDKTFEIPNPETTQLSSANWYGAQYYEIIPYQNRYLLLGWKGHTPDYSQRVIEVLEIKDSQAVLGASIFDHPDFEQQQRIIFSYSKQSSMFMQYQEKENWIVFDHLVPADPKYKDNYKFYGPDFTFDAWKLGPNSIRFLQNVELITP